MNARALKSAGLRRFWGSSWLSRFPGWPFSLRGWAASRRGNPPSLAKVRLECLEGRETPNDFLGAVVSQFQFTQLAAASLPTPEPEGTPAPPGVRPDSPSTSFLSDPLAGPQGLVLTSVLLASRQDGPADSPPAVTDAPAWGRSLAAELDGLLGDFWSTSAPAPSPRLSLPSPDAPSSGQHQGSGDVDLTSPRPVSGAAGQPDITPLRFAGGGSQPSPSSLTMSGGSGGFSGGSGGFSGGSGGSPAVVTVTASDAAASEVGPDPGEFTFSRSGDTSGSLYVSYSVSGTATNGSDYMWLNSGVYFGPGQASVTVPVSPNQDGAVEGDETVVVTLLGGSGGSGGSGGYTVGSPSSATVTIADAPAPVVTVTASDSGASEEGPDPGEFTFSRTGNTTNPLYVSYAVSGTATNGSDYMWLGGGVYFGPGQASVTVSVDPYDDTLVEWNETVTVTLQGGGSGGSGGSGGYLIGSPSSADVTISDNDDPTFTWSDVAPEAPTLSLPGSQSVAEGDSVSVQVSGSDPNGQSLTFGATNLPLGLSISSSGLITGTVDYRAAEFNGSYYQTTVILVNALGAYTYSTMDWWVSNTNRLPTLDPVGSQSTAEGGSPWLTLSGSDPDGDTLSFGATGLPPGLSVDPDTGWVEGTVGGSAMAGSPYTVTASVSDGTDTVTQTFQWVVTAAVPNADLVPEQRNAEGDTVSLQISATDPHGAGLQYSAINLPPGLSIDASTGLISGTIAAGAAQGTPYDTQVDISNGAGFVTRVIPWTVRHVLVTSPGDQTTLGGDTVSLQVQARDPQNDPLLYSATGLPAGLSIDANTGVISGTVSAGAVQGLPYSVTVSATDGTHSDSQTFFWTVSHSANVAPSLSNPGSQTSHVDQLVLLQLLATDPEQDVITYSATGLPSGIGIDPQTGLITGQLYDDAYSSSPFSVTVTADDGHGGVTSQQFQWSFALPNLSGTPQSISAVQGAEVTDAVVATFTDLQVGAPSEYWPYSATIDWGDGTSEDGFIDGANNNFQVRGTHTYKQVGTFTVQVYVTQGSLGSVTISSTVNVSNPALTASATAPSYTIDDYWSVPIAVFDDPNPFGSQWGYSATVTWADGYTSYGAVYGAGGKFAVYSGRSFPEPGSMGFTVSMTDNEGSTVSASGVATVGDVAAGNLASVSVALYGALEGYAPPSGYTATIDWGDGSAASVGVIHASGTTLWVSGDHRYTTPGSYTVTVNATSPLGETLTDTDTCKVARKPIQVFKELIETTVGEPLINTQVAVTVDPNNALPGAPSIDWGDGTTSGGSLSGGGGLYRLLGSTTYTASGDYLVSAEGDDFWKGFARGAAAGAVAGFLGGGAKVAPKADEVAPLKDEKEVTKGTLKWELTAPDAKGDGASIKITFVPKDNTATTIAFLQVVRERTVKGKAYFDGLPKGHKEFRMKSMVDKDKFDHIDAFPGETDPYYGAKWDAGKTKWVTEGGTWTVGNGPGKINAYMTDDSTTSSAARQKKGDVVVRFETAVFSVDTQEVLGVIEWGYKVPDSKDGKVELLGGTKADVGTSASAAFKKVIEQGNTVADFKHAQLDGSAKITKPTAKNLGGTSALP